MATTFTLIASVTVPATPQASIDFTSIPATYTDLCVKLSGRSSETTANDGTELRLQFNGDTAANYSRRMLYGDGGAVGSSSASTTFMRVGLIDTNGNTANTFANSEFYIPNYAGAAQKSVSADSVVEGNVAQFMYATLIAGLWTGTAAITSIKLTASTFNFLQYSTAYLYGISKT